MRRTKKRALRRLAQQHCTREDEVDDLLRGEVLVDLFAVVRQALAISEERYGLKNLERFYELARETDVKKGDESIVMFERGGSSGDQEILDDIERYNRDDCRSTLSSARMAARTASRGDRGVRASTCRCARSSRRTNLATPSFESLRQECVKRGKTNARRRGAPIWSVDCSTTCSPPQTEDEYRAMAAGRRTRYLLGNILAYHRREEKPAWWTYFDRCENVDRLARVRPGGDRRPALREDVAPRKVETQYRLYVFDFPDQLYKLAPGDEAANPRTRKAPARSSSIDRRCEPARAQDDGFARGSPRTIHELIPERTAFDEGTTRRARAHRRALFAGKLPEEYPATFDLLSSRAPASSRACASCQPDERERREPSRRSSAALDRSYLFIQGPPGSGKSTIGSQVICDLLAARQARRGYEHQSQSDPQSAAARSKSCMAARRAHFAAATSTVRRTRDRSIRSRLDARFIESAKSNEAFFSDDYQLAGGTGMALRAQRARSHVRLSVHRRGGAGLARRRAGHLALREATSCCSAIRRNSRR